MKTERHVFQLWYTERWQKMIYAGIGVALVLYGARAYRVCILEHFQFLIPLSKSSKHTHTTHARTQTQSVSEKFPSNEDGNIENIFWVKTPIFLGWRTCNPAYCVFWPSGRFRGRPYLYLSLGAAPSCGCAPTSKSSCGLFSVIHIILLLLKLACYTSERIDEKCSWGYTWLYIYIYIYIYGRMYGRYRYVCSWLVSWSLSIHIGLAGI